MKYKMKMKIKFQKKIYLIIFYFNNLKKKIFDERNNIIKYEK